MSIDQYYGTINSNASTAGTYAIIYTVPASGGCAVYTRSTPITITAAPAATISYAGSPYYQTGTATVTRTGTTGGTYSSTTGLLIDASSGTVNLSTSTPGNYTVTYTIAASGGCAAYSTTGSITVKAVTAKYYVNDNSNTGSVYTTAVGNDANAGTTSAPFLTINKAITVANAGDTIYVDAGTYAEQVNANKNITILGANAAISPNTGTRNAESILNNTTGSSVSITTVSRVVIKGFKVTTSASGSLSVLGNTAGSKVTLEKNLFDGSTGLSFMTHDSLLVVDNRFTNIAGNTDRTIFVQGNYNGTSGSYMEVYNNTWINSGCGGMNISSSKADIYNNTFSNIAYEGILVANYSSQNITRNVFTNINNPDVTVNTWGAGVRFYTPSAGMITNVTNNYFTNSFVGVATRSTDDVTGKTININNNSFSGNTFANINHTAAGVLSATCNWYGTTNVATINSTVLGNVLYCTFLGNGTDNDLVTAGFQPVPNSCTTPAAAISYTGTPYCSSAGTATVTFTGNAGGTYSSTTLGTALNTATGGITLASAPAGTHTVTYTIPALGGCSAYTTTASITITTQPNATGSYPGNPYCSNAGTAIPTGSVSGAMGTFSSTSGLSIDANYGTVNLTASTAGTYTINYTVPASGGCAVYTSTRSITIAAAPSATISYTASPYCATGTATVTLTGTTGGTYSSTAGLSLNASTGDVNLAASTPGTYTVTYTVAAAGPCGQFQTTSSITINAPGTWTGAVSTAWNVAANWQCGTVPNSTINVIIPSGLFNYPLVITTVAAKNLTIQAGATITITNGKLQIAGTATAVGKIIATNGKVEFNGTIAQTVPDTLFSLNTLKDLVITNAAGVSLGGPLKVTNTVSFGNVNNSALSSNGYLTLVSTSSNSANLSDITNAGVNSGNRVNGNVIVERFIQGKRAYRFLTAPVNSTGNIRANWMENTNNPSNLVNINPVPNYGTHITGIGGSVNGFDATSTNNPSLFTFNNATQSWIASPNTSGLFTAGSALRIMVRGSRSVDLNNNSAAPSATTLRATGTLVTGPVTFAASGGTAGMPALSNVTGAYNFIGNPYASSVNWQSVMTTMSNISPTLYIYDPTISGSNGRGGYVSYNGILNVKSLLTSLISKDVQSGQGFFVQTTAPNPSLTFNEAYKSSTFLPVFRTANDNPNINVQLLLPDYVDSAGSADGAAVYFSDDYSNKIGDEDSYKFTNLDENIAIVRDGTALSLEGRKPVTDGDSVSIKIWQLTQKSYTLKVTVNNFSSNLESYLQDKYLKTTTPLANGENLVPFSITADAASGASDRFKIVFETLATLPVRLTGIKAYVKNKGVQVEWVAESESNMDIYEVERSSDARHFETIGSAKAKNNPGIASAYNFFDASPLDGDNYYRIKSIEKSGDTKLSEVVRVQIANEKTGISVVNNPIQGNTIKLLFDNVTAGNYTVSLTNAAGEKMYEGKINNPGGTSSQQVDLNTHLAAGIYQLQVTNGATYKTMRVLIQ